VERTETRNSGQLLKIQAIGEMVLDVVHDPVHPGGVLPTRGCRGVYDHALTLTTALPEKGDIGMWPLTLRRLPTSNGVYLFPLCESTLSPGTTTQFGQFGGVACWFATLPDRLLRMPIPDYDKDRLATLVEERWLEFQSALSDRGRRYPTQDFKTFVQAARHYIAQTEKDPLVHRRVVNVIHGLTDCLKARSNQVPGEILAEADELECLMFAGYDPYFEGDEPPGL
jgi:hypothetical protein